MKKLSRDQGTLDAPILSQTTNQASPARQQHAVDSHFSSAPCMFRPVSRAYLSRKLTRPLPTKDGGTLRTVLDARAYMLRLSKDRERSAQWQPNYSLRRPMLALSAGNSNLRCSTTASSTLGRWHEGPNEL